ncbi:hypothetical protein BRARA_J00619 [Brassica rapa]|uniref:ATPase family AAA domain-containing protein n=1 Tax=Brassica campestris TaxID=3711 RepID=A0A397XRH0_BRACM|nr:uncharacterized protein LOC106436886 isoform X4 [Brassica napus]RID40583.1 hypothetical protein BRARA_J00619 [Brassica rapa]
MLRLSNAKPSKLLREAEGLTPSKPRLRQRKLAEDQRNLLQQQAQAKAQNLPYEDDLARKRLHTDHEAQRRQISCVFVFLKRILACVPTLSLAPIEAYPVMR